MKIFREILVVITIGLLVIFTACKPEEDVFTIFGEWMVESVTPPDGTSESGDWNVFSLSIEDIVGAADEYTIEDVPEGFEALWTADPFYFSNSPLSFSTSGIVDYSSNDNAFTLTFLETTGLGVLSFAADVEPDDSDVKKMTLTLSPNVPQSGRIDGLVDSWEFLLVKE